MRIPVGVNLESRDGTTDQDPRVLNGIIEQVGDAEFEVIKRPGMSDLGSIRSGTAQMLAYFNGQIISVIANNSDRSTLPLATNNIGALWQRSYAGASITRSGSTATVNAGGVHNLITGDSVTIAGANQPEYNGTYTITVTSPAIYTYTVPGTPATPATGTITETLNTTRQITFDENGLSALSTGYFLMMTTRGLYRLTESWTLTRITDQDIPCNLTSNAIAMVPGVVFLDGYFFIMDSLGRIWNSLLDADPGAATTSWLSTAFLTAEKEAGGGVALTRSREYVVAMKEWMTELFYDAANASPGSPLSPVDNGYFQIGCASGTSVTRLNESIYWIGKAKEKGRGVYVMRGLDHQKISTPDVDRILNADDLATVYAYGINIQGHDLYVITLVTSNITIVYDATAQKWVPWSSYTLNGSSTSVTSITRSGTTATVTCSGAHGLFDGDPVKIAGADQSDYNGIFQISRVSATVFTIEVANSPVTPATGTITATGYTESYFKFTKYVNAGGRDVFLHASDGHLYEMLTTTYQDNGIPINLFGRSVRMDGDTNDLKPMPVIRLVGDQVSDTVMVRVSDDDCNTFGNFRRIDLSLQKPEARRWKNFRRRTVEFRHIGNNPIRLRAFEF